MSGSYTLQILHGSDFEGGLAATSRADRFAAIVDKLEDQVTNSITLSAGDNFIPSPFSAASADPAVREAFQAFYAWLLDVPVESLGGLREAAARVDMAILNGIGVQASTIGNHEFDFGPNTFADALDFIASGSTASSIGAMFPYLSANLDFSGDSAMRNLFTEALRDAASYGTTAADLADAAAIAAEAADQQIAPWTTIEENGETIGVLGLTTQLEESLSSTGGVTVKDPAGDGGVNNTDELVAIIQPLIDQMTAQGINKIVLLSHLQQYQLEVELAAKLSGVDVIIAGGSHAIFADGNDTLRPGDAASETYPVIVNGADGKPTAIVSTSGEYSYVGRLVVTFDENGVIIPDSIDNAQSGAIATIDENVAALWGNEDAYADGTRGGEVRKLTDSVQEVISAKDGNVFGSSKVYLEGRRAEVRTEQTNLGQLSADANLYVAKQFDSEVMVSVKNGGGIRAEIGSISGQPIAVEGPTVANPTAGKPEGGVSQLDIENALRFNNALSVVTISAEGLAVILEHAVAGIAPGSTPGSFGQFSGIAFTYDPDATAQVVNATGDVITAGARIQSAAILNEDGTVADELIRDGELVGDAARGIKLVTLSFMVDGGDSYPFAKYVTDRTDLLNDPALDGGLANFTGAGSEQDAMAEYMAAFHSGTFLAYGQRDVGPEGDALVQNLAMRDGDVTQATLQATANTALQGTAANELVEGSAGDDIIIASAGRDTARGGTGLDVLDFGMAARGSGGLLLGSSAVIDGFTWVDEAVGTSTTRFTGFEEVRFADATLTFDGQSMGAIAGSFYALQEGGLHIVGQSYWASTQDVQAMASAFLAAPQSLVAELDDAGFVDTLYDKLLGRDAEAEGASYWTGQLAQGGDRASVLAQFASSAEAGDVRDAAAAGGLMVVNYEALLVGRLYDVVLDRDADVAGFTYWTDGEKAASDIAEGMLASDEYLNGGNGALDDAGFVAGLYQDALGRAGEAEGLAFWSSQLAAGMSRGEVVGRFITSAEGDAALGQLADHGLVFA
ncbi:5'-nucleotidase protein [Acetobacteraceae bacterium AT-5844]|nr:5'-nucleotidase protein [Acetobacteraceae bacterium AT-5844]